MEQFEEVGILLVEDNTFDAELTIRSFRDQKLANSVTWVKDGEEALDYVFRRGVYAQRTSSDPRLILLDLKMPRMDGFQVLDWLRQQPNLKRLPVIVFSSSDESQDVNRAYDLGANSYLVKPHALEDLVELVDRLKKYWLEVNQVSDSFAA